MDKMIETNVFDVPLACLDPWLAPKSITDSRNSNQDKTTKSSLVCVELHYVRATKWPTTVHKRIGKIQSRKGPDGPVRLAELWLKLTENTVLAEFLGEKNIIPAEKTSWIVPFSG